MSTTTPAKKTITRNFFAIPHRSPQFASLWNLQNVLPEFRAAGSSDTWIRCSLEVMPHEEREALRLQKSRQIERIRREHREKEIAAERQAMRLFLAVASERRLSRAFYRSRIKWLELFQSVDQSLNLRDVVASCSEPHHFKTLRRKVSGWLAAWERDELRHIASTKKRPTMAELLPLFACSGEIEFDAIDYEKQRKLPPRRNSVAGEFWNVGRDGGGQHEIRFRIAGNVPAAACALVNRLGSPSRNGGHIHLNCKGNATIGQSVFQSFRLALGWLRYLAPYSRRSGRFSSVENTPTTFRDSQRVKFAAVSCNTWGRTGTVELRLWGTTAKPEEWQSRAKLMQALARYGVEFGFTDADAQPITNQTGSENWLRFAAWAAENEPEALRQTINAMRAKGRRTRDRVGSEQCRQLVAAFDASGITLRGYRRRTITQPTTAGNN